VRVSYLVSRSSTLPPLPAFWRDDQLKQIGGPLVKQVTVCVDLGLPGEGSTLQECLSNLLDVVSDDALLKSVNLDVLMHTRAEEPRARVYALQCAEVIWRNHGSKLLGEHYFHVAVVHV
jgi:U3 small nucleolar RNA-associated protein 10